MSGVGCRVGMPFSMRLGLDQRDALLVVHDVQRLALQRHVPRRVLAVDLEAAEVDALLADACRSASRSPCARAGRRRRRRNRPCRRRPNPPAATGP